MIISNVNIPIDVIATVMIFKRPFSLNSAVINDPVNKHSNNNKSNDSGKGSIACGITKPRTIKRLIEANEIKPRYFFNTSTSLKKTRISSINSLRLILQIGAIFLLDNLKQFPLCIFYYQFRQCKY